MNHFLIGLIASMLALGASFENQSNGDNPPPVENPNPPIKHTADCTSLSCDGGPSGCNGNWTEG